LRSAQVEEWRSVAISGPSKEGPMESWYYVSVPAIFAAALIAYGFLAAA
jgi:hypothetical protein